MVRGPGQTLRGIEARHIRVRRLDRTLVVGRFAAACLLLAVCPRWDSYRIVHPRLWSARTHFPLASTKGTWRKEMGVVQSASCHIHWLACSRTAYVLHLPHAMATAAPVRRIAFGTLLLDATTIGLICAVDVAQFGGWRRWSTAQGALPCARRAAHDHNDSLLLHTGAHSPTSASPSSMPGRWTHRQTHTSYWWRRRMMDESPFWSCSTCRADA